MKTKLKFTKRQLFGAFLVSVPFIAVISFVMYYIGLAELLGVLGVTGAMMGFIFAGVHFLNTPTPRRNAPFKFF